MDLPKIEDVAAVVFDVGGVMLRTHDHAFRHAWDALLEQPPGTIEQLVFNSDLGVRAQTGEVTTDDHWRAVGDRLKVSESDLKQLRHDFWAGDRFDYDMIDWIRSWRHRVKTAIISNAFDDLRSVLRDEFQVADAFDLIVVSAEEGMMKPDPRIYQRTVERLNVAPAAAVFIDDSPTNIEGAHRVGMGAILYRPGVDLSTRLPFSAGHK